MKYIKIQKTVEFVVENILVILIYQRNSLTDSPTKFLNFGIKFKHTYSKLMRSFKSNYKNWFHPEITILDFTFFRLILLRLIAWKLRNQVKVILWGNLSLGNFWGMKIMAFNKLKQCNIWLANNWMKIHYYQKQPSFSKKKTLALVFSCQFCEISKNAFFIEHLRTTAFILQIIKTIFLEGNTYAWNLELLIVKTFHDWRNSGPSSYDWKNPLVEN